MRLWGSQQSHTQHRLRRRNWRISYCPNASMLTQIDASHLASVTIISTSPQAGRTRRAQPKLQRRDLPQSITIAGDTRQIEELPEQNWQEGRNMRA